MQISLAPATSDPARVTHFLSKNITLDEIPDTLKSQNYSFICWKISDQYHDRQYNRHRIGENFESASAIVIDIDDGLPVAAAQDRLERLGYNYFLITSRNHQIEKKKGDKVLPAMDRYHIILPLITPTTSAEKYRCARRWLLGLFPEMDSSATDLARFFFASPESAEFKQKTDGIDLDINTVQIHDSINLKAAAMRTHKKYWEFDPSMEIRLSSGEMITASEIRDKQPCFCPLPEHEDGRPSAFIDYVKERNQQMIFCSACDAIGWSKKEMSTIESFYFLGKDIIELGIAESQLFITKTSQEAYYVIIDANSDMEKANAFRQLVEKKRLSTIARVDYLGNPNVEADHMQVDQKSGIITVSIAAAPAKIQDNDFIENYLQETFGEHREFIKRYLAMYVYTNYIQLPTLILYGPRGCSKTTFASMVGAIFPSLHYDWNGESSQFTPEATKKLAVIEENELNDKFQYKLLKKYTGQKYLSVNIKYQPQYMVQNNMNIILLSNEAIPMYVEKSELPTDETNNQFFVYQFSPMEGKRDGNFQQKLRDRIGHYVRTELRQVFEQIDKNYPRYGIEVPITIYEKELFKANVTDVEANADLAMERIRICSIEHFAIIGTVGWIDEEIRKAMKNPPSSDEMLLYRRGYVAYSLLQKFATDGVHPNAIVKNLKKRGIIGESMRIQQNKQKFMCYKMISQEDVIGDIGDTDTTDKK